MEKDVQRGGIKDKEVFALPVGERWLVAAPLHGLTALVDRAAVRQLRAGLQDGQVRVSRPVEPVLLALRGEPKHHPQAISGPPGEPTFLGLVTTRACNMGCRYCDFAAPKQASPAMEFDLARQAVLGYLELLARSQTPNGQIHFFGGEPFVTAKLIHAVIEFARLEAAARSIRLDFEAITNGLYPADRARWIADHFQTIVLSLDGPADLQDRNRPAVNGHAVFNQVDRSARIFARSQAELILRACVTADAAPRLPQIAAWMADEYQPAAICFETLTPSALSLAARLAPPDPWEFARSFEAARVLLAARGIEAVLSTADLKKIQVNFCPVGKDALIVTPDGKINVCYLLENDWIECGLDFTIGKVDLAAPNGGERLKIDLEKLQAARNMVVDRRSLCANCFCRFTCAGGCYVRHDTSRPPGEYDDICVQTRLVTLSQLLEQVNLPGLWAGWWQDRAAQERAVWQADDRLLREGWDG